MKRINVIENDERSARWFDAEKATHFTENTWWNGSNHISKVTRSQTEHESIYQTKGGVFILNSWSQWQGSADAYEVISKERAAEWFVMNEYSDDDIPEIFKSEVAKLEIA